MKIKVSDYIADKLVEAGITRAFSVVGGGAMHLNDSLGHKEGLKVIYNHHEQASSMAAECYARINGRIAALCVTTGPGGTNAITGVAGGYLDSIPMFVVSGQVRYDWTARSSGVNIRSMGDQEFDITKAVDCMTKYAEMVIDPMRIRYCVEKALYLAHSGRPGPTWLDIPLDVQAAIVETDELIGFDPIGYEAGGDGWVADSEHKIQEDFSGKGESRQKLPQKVTRQLASTIIEKIATAKRPVFNAGNGIRIAGAHEVFMRVVEKLGIPVVVGWNSQDCLYNDHPLYVGRPGNFGDRPGNFAVQNSDLVFSVGSRLSLRQVGFNCKGWAREAYTIINDIDENELQKPTVHVSMPVHADALDLLTVMDEVLSERESTVWDAKAAGTALRDMNWLETCQMWKSKYPVVQEKHLAHGDDERANVYAFIHEIGLQAADDTITVVANGSPCVVGGHAYPIKIGDRFISNSAFASMGYGLPAAIGACIANEETHEHRRDVILLTGDGSLQMNLQELMTVITHKLPLKIFYINNGGYHSIRQTQKNFFGDKVLVGIGEDSYDLDFPSMEKLADVYGYKYFCAHHNSELRDAVRNTLQTEGAVICEAYVSFDQNFEPKSSGKQLADGRMVSPPLEDLTPFLSDEEMAENMIVPRMVE